MEKHDKEAFAKELQAFFEGEENIEFTAVDSVDGTSSLFTIKTDVLFCAPFVSELPSIVKEPKGADAVFRIGSNHYCIENRFRSRFAKEIRKARELENHSISLRTITVQSMSRVRCFVGDSVELVMLALRELSENLVIQDDTIRRIKKDVGRKVGHAAKDWALLRGKRITLESLADYELYGEEVAWKLVQKDAVLPPQSLDELKKLTQFPSIALAYWTARRRLLVRPARGEKFRKLYVRTVTRFFEQLLTCETSKQAGEVANSILASMKGFEKTVLGNSFVRFAKNLRYSSPFFEGRNIEQLPADEAWESVRRIIEAQSTKPANTDTGRRPLPESPKLPLAILQRIGPEVAPVDDPRGLMDRYGFTGIEIGKWVGKAEQDLQVSWIASSCTDLVRLLGDWVVRLSRAGNLALSIGGRGKGKACAHYEPGLKTINLTKDRSQGKFAHEFAHFIDHQLSIIYAPNAQTPFLSEQFAKGLRTDRPVPHALCDVMSAIGVAGGWNDIVGNAKPRRWYLSPRVLTFFKESDGDIQETYDKMLAWAVEGSKKQFANSATCQCVADSIAKWTEKEVQVRSFHVAENEYVRNARRLGVYWIRPLELFARAFEAWVEDQLHNAGEVNQYLVSRTTIDYSKCRGKPYPVDDDRKRINDAISGLVIACAREL